MNVLVSACLLGLKCRYDGKDNKSDELLKVISMGYNLIPVCPEQLGGLSTPRKHAEIIKGRVMNIDYEDVTENFIKGANEVLKLSKLYKTELAVLKERSPSCGFGEIYNGKFNNVLIKGNGICADLLFNNKIKIIGESLIKKYFRL
ncbi:hypothetical protein BHAMNSH16_01595 [Brachyspira hampsonii]|uniref:Purine-nucleoside phosphorylase n=1 Tax=Brachyspira hampsonii TaxID=1287055 RepID=A0AAC9TS46_9SPIR|nr:DUF523 domain-containing protein [Brachyspira hampsonii]ASJ20423.1 hypothetical protein BHAMNSH16_01595 [Brachyspira hampsonii]OEJ18610.1 hypothetical protein A9496_07170 [Brachyspira hampsonii]